MERIEREYFEQMVKKCTTYGEAAKLVLHEMDCLWEALKAHEYKDGMVLDVPSYRREFLVRFREQYWNLYKEIEGSLTHVMKVPKGEEWHVKFGDRGLHVIGPATIRIEHE